MPSTVEKLSPTRVKLTIDVPFDGLTEEIEAAYKQIATQVNIPGFRKGKVPSSIIDQRVGRGAVLEDVVNSALPRAYNEAVAEHELAVLAQPEVDLVEVNDGDNFVFTAEVDIRPEYDLPDYEGIAVTVDPAVKTDEDIDEQLLELRKRFGTLAPVERAAKDGDVVVIDVEGHEDSNKLEEFSAIALTYEVGSSGMVEGADEAIRGLSEGESATFDFTPEEGEHSGKKLDISVTVKGVRERELPESDDEFAQLASEFDTIAELKEDLSQRVDRMKLVEQGMQAREKVLESLLAAVEISLPESLLASQVDDHFKDGHGDDDHRAEVEKETADSLKTQFILDDIADKEELSVGQAELTQWLMTQAPRYGMTPDQFAQTLVEGNQIEMAVADVRRGKALAHILQKANVTDTDGLEIDLTSLDESTAEADLEELMEAAQTEEVGDDEAVEAAEDAISEVEAEEESK